MVMNTLRQKPYVLLNKKYIKFLICRKTNCDAIHEEKSRKWSFLFNIKKSLALIKDFFFFFLSRKWIIAIVICSCLTPPSSATFQPYRGVRFHITNNGYLIISRNCLPFASTWVHLRYPMLPVSLGCTFLIAPLVYSNVYQYKTMFERI